MHTSYILILRITTQQAPTTTRTTNNHNSLASTQCNTNSTQHGHGTHHSTEPPLDGQQAPPNTPITIKRNALTSTQQTLHSTQYNTQTPSSSNTQFADNTSTRSNQSSQQDQQHHGSAAKAHVHTYGQETSHNHDRTTFSVTPDDVASCHTTHLHQRTTVPQTRTSVRHPYNDNYRGSTWNAEGLICNNTHQQQQKTWKLKQLAQSHDFTIITETHGTTGKATAFRLPHETTAFWTHKHNASAGLLCMVSNSFLQRFEHPPDWHIYEPGHLAKLHLSGTKGDLHIWCIYLPSGAGRAGGMNARSPLIRTMAINTPSPQHGLTIMAGDWNFVTHHHDRLCLNSNNYTGERDSAEATQCNTTLLQPKEFHELQQDNYTYLHPVSTSKLDRVLQSPPTDTVRPPLSLHHTNAPAGPFQTHAVIIR